MNSNHLYKWCSSFPHVFPCTWSICSFGRSQLCSQRRVRPGRSPTWWPEKHPWTDRVVLGVHYSSKMLLKIMKPYEILIYFGMIWDDEKMIKGWLVNIIKCSNDPPFVAPLLPKPRPALLQDFEDDLSIPSKDRTWAMNVKNLQETMGFCSLLTVVNHIFFF